MNVVLKWKDHSPRSFINKVIYEPVPKNKKKGRKVKEKDFIIPNTNDYNSLLVNNFNVKQLKAICKHYKLKVSGNKDEKIHRIYNYLKYSHYTVKIQRIYRGFLVKKLFKLKPQSKILVIAGSDSSGGAGIQADIKTITALGSYAMTAITAVTIQNTTGVKSIVPIDPKEISNQIEFTSKDIKPDAIKIGMLHSPSVIKAVIFALKKVKVSKIVLDPVMIAKGGAKLINNNAIHILKNHLIKTL